MVRITFTESDTGQKIPIMGKFSFSLRIRETSKLYQHHGFLDSQVEISQIAWNGVHDT